MLLCRHGIPDKIVELLKELYTDTCSYILTEGIRSEWFQVLTGVRQGCTFARDLFLNPMDRTVEQSPLSVSVGKEHFTDLDYANDAAFLVEMLQTLVAGLLVLQDEAAPLGLQIN